MFIYSVSDASSIKGLVMPESILKQGSLLLVAGLDVSKPAEYISAQAATTTQNMTIDRGILTKRYGTIIRGSGVVETYFLLQEDGNAILLESGDTLLVEA